MTVHFVEKHWSDLSSLQLNTSVADLADGLVRRMLCVRFTGHYHQGSGGTTDALFMHAMVRAAVTAWEPDGIILDYSELDYQWGDEMEWLLPDDDGQIEDTPAVVVVGPQSQDGIRTLLFGVGSTKTFVDTAGIYEDLVAAVDALDHQLRQ